jgi:succinate-semialdehyde dehydrogenase/glutarate-semialdehyde dehydrogenase
MPGRPTSSKRQRRGAPLFGRGATFERSKIMRKAAELLRSYADAIARLLTQEEGKTLVEAKGEVMAGANIIDWFGEPELLARYRTHAPYNVR